MFAEQARCSKEAALDPSPCRHIYNLIQPVLRTARDLMVTTAKAKSPAKNTRTQAFNKSHGGGNDCVQLVNAVGTHLRNTCMHRVPSAQRLRSATNARAMWLCRMPLETMTFP